MDDIFDNLPEERDLAFLMLEAEFRKHLDALQKLSMDNDQGWDRTAAADYVNQTVATMETLGIDKAGKFSGIASSKEGDWDTVQNLRSAVDAYKIQTHLSKRFNLDKNIVMIGESEKQIIRHYLNNIKEVVDKWDLEQRKKNAIFDKINRLAAEVDNSKTRLENIADMTITLADAAGQAVEKLEPLRKWMDPLERLFGKAKARQEEAIQISYNEPKQIEGPKTEPKKLSENTPFDDEIPF